MKQYGLIGFPLIHSFSKKYFTAKFLKENIDAGYELYELESIDAFSNLIEKHTLVGLNVTIPYKEQVIPYLDELDPAAEAIGAVNVIRFFRKNNQLHLKGYNSDYIGFSVSIRPFITSKHKKALVLGTGGASKAVAYALEEMGIEVAFVSRRGNENGFTYEELDATVMSRYKLIVNTTPLGTFPDTDRCPAIPYELLDDDFLLYDLVYNPAETLFMKKGKEYGAVVVNGEEMLVLQAEEAWRIWNQEDV